MSQITNTKVAYGKSQPLIDIFNQPVVALRDPNGNDKGSIGQQWTNKNSNGVWMLTSFLGGLAVWTRLDNGAPNAFNWLPPIAVGPTQLANNTGYVYTGAATYVTTLPINSAVGNEIWIVTTALAVAPGVIGLTITQNVGQRLLRGNLNSVGANGFTWTFGTPNISVHLMCTVANTEWVILTNTYNPAIF
jgi:hypothetical protein